MAFTHANEKVGLQCLAHYDWKLDIAIDHYFQSPERFSQHGSSSIYGKPSVDRRKIEQLFLRYKGRQFTSILPTTGTKQTTSTSSTVYFI